MSQRLGGLLAGLPILIAFFLVGLSVRGITFPGHTQLTDARSIRFIGLRPLTRITNTVQLSVQATDPAGVARIEVYVDQTLISGQDVPNLPTVIVSVNWDTTLFPNGKHMLQARGINSDGSIISANIPAITTNSGASAAGSITIIPSIRHQTIIGWEAVAQAGQLGSPAWANYRNALFDQAVTDLGLNRIRLELTSGTENPVDYFSQWRSGVISAAQYNSKRYEIVNDDPDPANINASGFQWSALNHTVDNVVLPMRQRLEARGESLWISVNYVDFGSSVFEHKTSPAEYAEFVLATYRHLQNVYGIVPNSWEVILEPDTSTANWTPQQVALAVRAAGDLLATNSFTPNFIVGSTTNAQNTTNYIDAIAETPGAIQYVGEFAYHRYCCASSAVLRAISDRAVKYNKKTAMLEWIGADHNTLHEDLKVGRNSAWQQYTIAYPNEPDNGAQYYLVNDSDPNNPTIALGSRTKFLRQYFKFVRSGAQRIEATSANAALDPLAFINTNGKYVVVVKSTASLSFSVGGLPGGVYGVKYTTPVEYDVDLPNRTISAGQLLSASIPSGGVITIYAR